MQVLNLQNKINSAIIISYGAVSIRDILASDNPKKNRDYNASNLYWKSLMLIVIF